MSYRPTYSCAGALETASESRKSIEIERMMRAVLIAWGSGNIGDEALRGFPHAAGKANSARKSRRVIIDEDAWQPDSYWLDRKLCVLRWHLFEPAEKASDLIQHDLRLLAMGSVASISKSSELQVRGKWTQ